MRKMLQTMLTAAGIVGLSAGCSYDTYRGTNALLGDMFPPARDNSPYPEGSPCARNPNTKLSTAFLYWGDECPRDGMMVPGELVGAGKNFSLSQAESVTDSIKFSVQTIDCVGTPVWLTICKGFKGINNPVITKQGQIVNDVTIFSIPISELRTPELMGENQVYFFVQRPGWSKPRLANNYDFNLSN
jgi:hypothetical protein